MGPLRQAVQRAESEKAKLESSLQAAVKSKNELETAVQSAQDEIERHRELTQQLRQARDTAEATHRQQVQQYEARLENLRVKLTKQRDKSIKETNRDAHQVLKQ